jgi:hypothetical protein
LCLVEAGSSLEGVALDVIERDFEWLSRGFGDGCYCGYGGWYWARREEGFKAFS